MAYSEDKPEDSKLILAGHELEGISIAGQVSYVTHLVLFLSVSQKSNASHVPGRMLIVLVSVNLCSVQETCIVWPSANIVFDSGRCPQRSVYRRNLFITHAHLDHIGGIAMHICSR